MERKHREMNILKGSQVGGKEVAKEYGNHIWTWENVPCKLY